MAGFALLIVAVSYRNERTVYELILADCGVLVGIVIESSRVSIGLVILKCKASQKVP